MAKLDDKVPYALALGNHDFDAWACGPAGECDPWDAIENDRGAALFNENFPRTKFSGRPSTYEDDHEGSYFRVMEFDPAAKPVSVETYSPYLCRESRSRLPGEQDR